MNTIGRFEEYKDKYEREKNYLNNAQITQEQYDETMTGFEE